MSRNQRTTFRAPPGLRPIQPGRPARLLTTLILFGTACQTNDRTRPPNIQKDVPSFVGSVEPIRRVDTLTHRGTIGDSAAWGQPTALLALGRFLLVGDRFAAPHLVVIDRATNTVHSRFGPTGDGPREFRIPLWFVADTDREHHVWVYDFGRRDLTLIDLARPAGSNIVARRAFNPPRQIAYPVVRGDTVVATGFSTSFALLTMTRTARILDSTVVSPPFGPREVPDQRGRLMANARVLGYRPTSHDVVLAYMHTPRLDFFDPQGIHRGSVTGPRRNEIHFGYRDEQFGFEPEHQGAYMSVVATDAFVYALYCGCRANFDYDKVHVFDWGGNFRKEIVLDLKVAAIAVSPDDSTLFGIVHDPWPAIGTWELPAH